MKKFLIIGAIALVGAVAIAGCGEKKPDTTTTNFDKLSELAAKGYSTITLQVDTTVSGEQLTGTYTSKAESDGYTVTYSYEKINTIQVGDDGITVPDSLKTTYQGTLKNGEVVEGDEPDFDAALLTASGLNFAKENFKNASDENGKLSASVSDVKGFFGKEFAATNMTMEVQYTSEKLNTLTIRYTSGGAQVVMTYSFS